MLILIFFSSMILQQTSWGALTITSEAARKLFSSRTVFPGFLAILDTFGERTCLESDGHGSFQTVSHSQPESSGRSTFEGSIVIFIVKSLFQLTALHVQNLLIISDTWKSMGVRKRSTILGRYVK